MLHGEQASATFAKTLTAAPLAVFNAANQAFVPIPASLDPLVIDDEIWRLAARDCRLVLKALRKVVIWLRRESQRQLAQQLFGHLTGIEYDAAFGRLDPMPGLATVRFDFFFEDDDVRILEVNCTIPAMQAYGDMIRHGYFQAVASTNSRTLIKQRTNVADLHQSLLTHYAAGGGTEPTPRIAIIARAGDSQIAELQWLKLHWQAAGHQVVLGTPDDVSLRQDQLYVADQPVDLTYRHIFAYRLPEGSPFANACRRARAMHVYNPVSAHFEVKALLAVTSQVADEEAMAAGVGLTPEELGAVQRRVPWTRIVSAADTRTLAHVRDSAPEELVLKTSAGYGGHGVVIGATLAADETQARLRQVLQTTGPITWRQFVDAAVSGKNGLWIAQRRIPGKKFRHRFLDRDGSIKSQDSYVDCSLFTDDLDTTALPGGAARFANDPIVNIGRGGGLAPLLLASEAAQLAISPHSNLDPGHERGRQ